MTAADVANDAVTGLSKLRPADAANDACTGALRKQSSALRDEWHAGNMLELVC